MMGSSKTMCFANVGRLAKDKKGLDWIKVVKSKAKSWII